MDIVGSDIGYKMRSAIKAKLTELGCYVDDELPDYVMVMVANKRTRSQMEEDLQLFLGGNTELFVNWLHQVLKHLQEVSVSTAQKQPVNEAPNISKPKSISKEHKEHKKEKKAPKEKHKKSDGSTKKSKKESKKKDKELRKKVSKKSKKKSKSEEAIRPNVPPLLMNLEKESEPSITDVFAGQILKNHGITLEQSINADKKALEDIKPVRKALKRTKFPIIDPATVSNVTDPEPTSAKPTEIVELTETGAPDVDGVISKDTATAPEKETSVKKRVINTAATDVQNLPREEQIREMNEIEAKILGLKKKLADQLDSMSEDEDFLNIRTEAEELMNDFAEDVLQEISAAQSTTASAAAPPLGMEPAREEAARGEAPRAAPVAPPPSELPHIELQLPKRPMRERLGVRPEPARPEKRAAPSAERLTPETEPPAEERGRSTRGRAAAAGAEAEREHGRRRHVDLPERSRDEPPAKRLLSRVSARRRSEERPRAAPASVVRVRPRPRLVHGAPPPALLMRAVADAHKSLLSVAPKVDSEPQVKRALVLPMRRTVDTQNIVIQVQTERVAERTSQDTSDCEIDLDTESLADLVADDNYKAGGEYAPEPIKRTVSNQRVQRAPSRTGDGCAFDDVIKIHNPTVGKERGPQFVVTLDGLDPNMFLAKKLKTEGISDEITANAEQSKDEAPIEKLSNEVSAFSKEVTETNVPKLTKTSSSREKTQTRIADEAVKSQSRIEIVDTQSKTVDESVKSQSRIDAVKIQSRTVDEAFKSVTIKVEPEEKPIQTDNALNKTSPKKKTADAPEKCPEKRRSNSPPAKKKCVSPIVFDVKEKEKEKVKEKTRERKESVSSDITITTTSSTKKYDSLPSLPAESRRLPCRTFPGCRFGGACAFAHPRCKFAAACTRRDCVYSHPAGAGALAAGAAVAPVKPSPVIASHVVAVGNYKSVSAAALPATCRYFPACANPACPFLHPKPCRYGRACLNKSQCNFYHDGAAASATKWRSPFQV